MRKAIKPNFFFSEKKKFDQKEKKRNFFFEEAGLSLVAVLWIIMILGRVKPSVSICISVESKKRLI